VFFCIINRLKVWGNSNFKTYYLHLDFMGMVRVLDRSQVSDTHPTFWRALTTSAQLGRKCQWSVQYLIQNTDTNLSGSKFPSNHLKLERSPGVLIFTHAYGTLTVAQLCSGRCRYDPHFPSMYTFITRSLFSCCWYSGKFRSNRGADVSTIKKHLQQIY